LPAGYALQEAADAESETQLNPERAALSDAQQRFWAEFLADLKLDDPEQPIPRPARLGYLGFMLPAPAGSSWLTVYRDARRNEVGVYLSSSLNGPGEYAMQSIADDWGNVGAEPGGTAALSEHKGRPCIIDSLTVGTLDQPEIRKQAFAWLGERVNTFVNVMRPRVRSAVADYQSQNK
jgi:hypothetical protein